jgi:hypothetical protein
MAPFSRRALGISALYGLLSVVFSLPFDAAQHVEYRRLPFWMWQYPHAAILSPAWLLSAVLPPSWAVDINLVLHCWIALLGMHLLLTRAVGLSFLPLVAFAASLFTLGGAMALHVAAGDAAFLPLCSLPLAAFLIYRTTQAGAVRDALSAAAILALAIYDGGLEAAPIAAIAIVAWTACLAIAGRDWRPLAIAVVTAACAAAYAGPKLVPALDFLTGDRSPAAAAVLHPDRTTPDMLWRAYTDASLGTDANVSGAQRRGWWEYGNYVGLLALILIGVGLLWPLLVPSTAHRSFAVMLALMAVWFLLLSAGEFSSLAPAPQLSSLPLLSSVRSYSEYTIAFAFFAALAVGAAGRDAIRRTQAASGWRIALTVVCALATAQLLIVNRQRFRDARPQPPLAAVVAASSVEPLRVWTDGPAQISSVRTTFNGVRFSVIGGFAPSRVFLNQRYVPGWTSSAGPIVSDAQAGGRMAVQLAAGQTGSFSFSFVPPGLVTGLILLLAAAAVSVLAWNRRWTPVTYERAAHVPRGTAISYTARAEHVSKQLVLWSMLGAVFTRALLGGANQTTLLAIVAGAFVLARLASALREDVDGLVLASMFVAPAVFAHVWTHDGSVYSMYLAAGLLGAIWPQWSRTRWSLPSPWRVPLVAWALVAAVSWPIVALREVDFHPEITGILEMPNSFLDINARGAITIAADATAVLLLGILWADWLFQRYAADGARFRRAVIRPLIVAGSVSSAFAAYQLFVNPAFLNEGWAVFHRASGTMVDANGFGMAAVLCSCACIALLDRRRDASKRFLIAGCVLTSLGAWASGSRTALMAEVIALAFAASAVLRRTSDDERGRQRFRRRAVAIAAAAIVAVAVLWSLRNTGPVLRLGWIMPSASVASVVDFARQMLWVRFGYGPAAVEMIRSSPWFGVGVGSFQLIVGDYRFSHMGSGLPPDNAQNWIRHNLAELGLVGSLGWIVWAIVLLVALVRGSTPWRDRGAMILFGTLVGVVIVSQVGMPTQNPGVALLFWTFLFWFCATQSSNPPEAARRSNEGWKWAAAVVVVVTFAAGSLWTSLTLLRPPMRARRAGWNYDYGFYLPRETPAGEVFRWTKQDAVAVVPAQSREVKLTVWAEHIDANHPVMARVWHDDTLVIDAVLRDDRPVSTDVVIDKNPQWLMVRTYLDRTPPQPQPDFGLAVQWTFVGAPAAVTNVPVR